MKNVNDLTKEERAKLAAISRQARPDANYRIKFAKLVRAKKCGVKVQRQHKNKMRTLFEQRGG
jgi:hypothetical protein